MNKFTPFIGKPGSLLWWISVALIGFGIVVSVVLAIQSFSSQRLIEHKIWRDMLESLSSDYATRIERGQKDSQLMTGVIRSWYLEKSGNSSSKNGRPPTYFANLPAGYYSSEGMFMDDGIIDVSSIDSFHVLIKDIPSGRIVTMIDIAEIESEQNRNAVISALLGVFLFSLIAAAIAWLHHNLVHPVRDLADRMQSINPDTKNARLPTNYQREEIQIIAQASNAHLERVEKFIERERSLLDQASHEFRTPIAVISGAVDVLKQIALPDSSKPALNRIEHAIEDLSETMVALLYLAREAHPESEPVDVTVLHELLPRLIQDHEHLLGEKSAQLKIGEIESTFIAVPEAMIRIAVSNLIRNAIENTDTGFVEVTLREGIISVTDSGCGFNPVEAARRYRDSLRQSAPARGQGLGIFLIGRICDRFDWKLSIQRNLTGGTSATLDVTASLIKL